MADVQRHGSGVGRCLLLYLEASEQISRHEMITRLLPLAQTGA